MACGSLEVAGLGRISLLRTANFKSGGLSSANSNTTPSILPATCRNISNLKSCGRVIASRGTGIGRWGLPRQSIRPPVTTRGFLRGPNRLKDAGVVAIPTFKRASAAVGDSAGLTSDIEATEGLSEASDSDDFLLGNKIGSDSTIEGQEVTEIRLTGNDTEVQEIGDSLYSVKTLKKLVVKLGEGGKQFVVNSVGGVVGIFKMGQKQEEPELLAFSTSMYETKDGVSALRQWTATELTMQHAQLMRIATDINYLVFAFGFFGFVRVLEAILATFSTDPPKFKRLTQASNAMDPLTVAWLAYNLRKPILGMLQVDPTDLQKLSTLKVKLWEELHAFFERQWKVVSCSLLLRVMSRERILRLLAFLIGFLVGTV